MIESLVMSGKSREEDRFLFEMQNMILGAPLSKEINSFLQHVFEFNLGNYSSNSNSIYGFKRFDYAVHIRSGDQNQDVDIVLNDAIKQLLDAKATGNSLIFVASDIRDGLRNPRMQVFVDKFSKVFDLSRLLTPQSLMIELCQLSHRIQSSEENIRIVLDQYISATCASEMIYSKYRAEYPSTFAMMIQKRQAVLNSSTEHHNNGRCSF